MKYHANKEILPREIDIELDVILKKFTSIIDEIVDLGTHILKIDYELKRKGKDNNIPTAFFRNCLELADGISILMKSSSIESSKLLLRTLFENSLSLIYMIQKDEKIRVHSYLVWKAHQDIQICKRLIDEEHMSKAFVKQLQKENSNFKLDDIRDINGIRKTINAKEELLKLPFYEIVEEEYQRIKLKFKMPAKNWYSLYNGPKDFAMLCQEMNSTLHYHFNYKKYSQNVHGMNILNAFILLDNDKAQLKQIRDFRDCREVFIGVVDLIMNLYFEFIEKRIPNEIIGYSEWSKTFFEKFKKTLNETKFKYV